MIKRDVFGLEKDWVLNAEKTKVIRFGRREEEEER